MHIVKDTGLFRTRVAIVIHVTRTGHAVSRLPLSAHGRRRVII